MALRQDHKLAEIHAFAVDKSDNALLLKSKGLAQNTKVVKSKLIGIDPNTKALLVKWIDSLPGGENGAMTGEQIVALLEALAIGSRLSHTALDDVVSGSHHVKTVSGDINLNDLAEKNHISLANVSASQHHVKYTDAEAIAATSGETNALDWLGL